MYYILDEDGDSNGIYEKRYTTYDEALKGHEETIEWVKRGCKDE